MKTKHRKVNSFCYPSWSHISESGKQFLNTACSSYQVRHRYIAKFFADSLFSKINQQRSNIMFGFAFVQKPLHIPTYRCWIITKVFFQVNAY